MDHIKADVVELTGDVLLEKEHGEQASPGVKSDSIPERRASTLPVKSQGRSSAVK